MNVLTARASYPKITVNVPVTAKLRRIGFMMLTEVDSSHLSQDKPIP